MSQEWEPNQCERYPLACLKGIACFPTGNAPDWASETHRHRAHARNYLNQCYSIKQAAARSQRAPPSTPAEVAAAVAHKKVCTCCMLCRLAHCGLCAALLSGLV